MFIQRVHLFLFTDRPPMTKTVQFNLERESERAEENSNGNKWFHNFLFSVALFIW